MNDRNKRLPFFPHRVTKHHYVFGGILYLLLETSTMWEILQNEHPTTVKCIHPCYVLCTLGAWRGSQAWLSDWLSSWVGCYTGAEASITSTHWLRGQSQRHNSDGALNSIIKMDALPTGMILNLDPILNLNSMHYVLFFFLLQKLLTIWNI